MWNTLSILAVPLAKLIMLLIDKSNMAADNKKKLLANFQQSIEIMSRDRAAAAELRGDSELQNNDLDAPEQK